METMRFEFEAFCPQCGAQLAINDGLVEPDDDTPLVCPNHGRIGVFKDIREQVVAKAGDKLTEDMRDQIERMFRDAGFKPD